MISTLGNVLQVLAMVVALAGAVCLMAGVKGRREGLVNAGYLLVFGNTVALTVCVAIILLCFLTQNFSLAYVASNFPQTDSPLLPLYQVAGVWAGRQGSLLFWTWLISLFSGVVAWRRMRVTDDLSSAALAVAEVIVALFCATLVFSESNNPFIATAAQYLNDDGTLVSTAGGMNPLLLHWAMVLHPPATFIGYAGCTIPFAYAMAALITGDTSARWVELCDRIAVFAFIFLTIGMALGAVWAYVVLGWGGFWAWDAVENASLFSWLTAVAMIHSFTMYRKRGCFKRWSMFAAAITFIFVVLGTFITRSGLVQSVHAFAEDPVSTYFFLAIMVLAALSFLILMLYRHGTMDDAEEVESLASKGGTYYLTDLVCIVGAVLVAYLTVSSSLPSWMPLGGQVVSAGVYNAVARPATALFGLLMAVCPMLGWRRTDGAAFARNMRVPAILGAVLFVVLMVYFVTTLVPAYDAIVAAGGDPAATLAEQGPRWYYFALTVVSFLAAALLFATSAYLLGRGVRGRMRSKGENPVLAIVNLFRHSPAQAGGYLAHLGCAIALVGLVGSGMYVQEHTINLSPDASEDGYVYASDTVGGYQLILTGVDDYFDEADSRIMRLHLTVSRAVDDVSALEDQNSLGDVIGELEPSMEVSATTQQQTLHAGVLTFPTEDLFVAFQGTNADGTLSVNVKVNPLILCNWIGGGIVVAGIALAFLPRRATPLLAADERKRG
ncbi:cytochrome c biogenesis protein CcsA [Collinsella sp. An2]|uniref:heme lyase CcmF/NrfE family subunit n=1 Tax=Collinsella sp. An2 TaxID=1965585 RepID=UPI000B3A62AD|nr:cytochrome c biogenesis protein CcsA [Collinsella sp. An2]OUP06813.1 hypothetical protein B5F33_09705 [Collinsella sp. An2]